MRPLYYDVAEICAPGPVKCLMKVTDPSHILVGSDFPFSRHLTPAEDVKAGIAGFDAFDGWNAGMRRRVESENAWTDRLTFPLRQGTPYRQPAKITRGTITSSCANLT